MGYQMLEKSLAWAASNSSEPSEIEWLEMHSKMDEWMTGWLYDPEKALTKLKSIILLLKVVNKSKIIRSCRKMNVEEGIPKMSY